MKLLNLLLILIILLSISTTAFIAYQYQSLKKQLVQYQTNVGVERTQPPLTSTQRPTPIIISTANWLTFANSAYTFQYPPEAATSSGNQYLFLKTDSYSLRFDLGKMNGKNLKDVILSRYDTSTIDTINLPNMSGFTFGDKDPHRNWYILELQSNINLEILTQNNCPDTDTCQNIISKILNTLNLTQNQSTTK